jgi:uncharacterized protein YggE
MNALALLAALGLLGCVGAGPPGTLAPATAPGTLLAADSLTSSPAQSQDKPVATLTVRGKAELSKPADQLRLRLGVVTKSAQAKAALVENSRRMNEVITALEKVGLVKGEYETGRFSLQPVYTRRPRQPDPDWRPQIVGYEVTNTLSIKTQKLELAGELIEAGNEAGANTIDVVGFDLADPRTHRAEAIATATAHAIADARTLADAASLRLARIISVNLDQAAPRPPIPPFGARGGATAPELAVPPPITPGQVTIRADVTLVYEIEPRN